MRTPLPPGLVRAKEIAARLASPVGQKFAAKRSGTKAQLYIYATIGKNWEDGISAEDVVSALDAAKGADELEVFVNSPGGEVFDGVAIYNAIRRFEGKKTVYVDGLAASIASVIALAGDRVVTNSGATWMIHDPWSGVLVWGTADEIESAAQKEAAALRKIRECLVDTYVSATGQTPETVSKWMTGETWMTADEALARGFCDEVCKPEPAMPMEPEEPENRAAAFRPSPHVEAQLARERFARASPGRPGQPGHTNRPGDRQKDQR